ncbi:ComC/BlpC family leader-containing pheromone/bacteriocin [Flammeovirga aprica]|uniref:ComC/BlpC family leader-containing pheromone/bacteriocin n=1 Tax=Flammeovirga aprica JL-4 TaxID=694437 RepID=A0A7X9S230_9BACT|nr:ComC/BlpC family leader-containing pheromone/bacteriocin [Flammeovirga aprica]NME72878.1 ComC/BlpC family leader-containing pheromone/bacteriocin [Flammeovirga aprica JL-4]NME72879.1 ComC/BlpC family leader-containing pheromone/bacteriocin [Flammeovirga aprica JL-4]
MKFQSIKDFEELNSEALEIITGGNIAAECSKKRDVDTKHHDALESMS